MKHLTMKSLTVAFLISSTALFAEGDAPKVLEISKGFRTTVKEAERANMDVSVLATSGTYRGTIVAVEGDMIVLKQMVDRYNAVMVYIRFEAVTGIITH